MNIAVICRGSGVFLEPLFLHWTRKGYNIVNDIPSADVVFCEWANEQSIIATRESQRKNVIIRLHGSEYYQDYHTAWDKSKVFTTIQANPTYIIEGVKQTNVPIPIDTTFWSNTNSVRNMKSIVVCGSFVYSKNHIGLLNMLSNNNYFNDIIFVGALTDKDPLRQSEINKVLKQIEYLKVTYNLPVRLVNHMNKHQLKELFNTSGYIASPSINEGFHCVISEAVLCGCSPIVYAWSGAKEIYNIDTYHNNKTFWDIIERPETDKLKSHILNNFNKETVFECIDALLEQARSN